MKITRNLDLCDDCENKEEIPGHGIGCVRPKHLPSPWMVEWKRIPYAIQNCGLHRPRK